MKPLAALLSVAAALLLGRAAFADDTDGLKSCLECHSDKDATMTFEDGQEVSIFVDKAQLQHSVHKTKLLCIDCHRGYADAPHPETTNKTSHRAYVVSLYDMCRRCHFANYTRTLEGVHYKLLNKNNAKAPTCVDCHGSHDMKPAARPKSDISNKCARCHEKVYAVYKGSVHGKALLDEKNEDVPVCTDCHRAHDIADPRKPEFTQQVPTLCGRCHADEERMKKYDLSTAVLKTYLADFHGVTNKMQKEEGHTNGTLAAVCTDCHGVHDIATTKNRTPTEIRTNLQKACAKCHEGASVTFPDAWLPHYEPSPARAPLVFGVRVFYWIFIPLVIGGLLLQILLHIWRIAVNR